MNKIILKLATICLFSTLIFSCKEKENKEQVYTFAMSDSMYASCTFDEVKTQKVSSDLRLFGKVVSDNNKLAHVYPAVGGNVVSINVELGDYVKQGQVLASVRSIEVADFKKEKLNAASDVAVAEKNLQVANDLFEGKLNSEKDVIAARRELEQAKAELSRINEVFSIYNLKNGTTYNITAPMSGFIIYKDVNQNELLRSDKLDILFSIAEINEVWVLANVNESDIGKVSIGIPAEVKSLSFPDRIFSGKVDKFFNAIDPETKAMKVRVKISNQDLSLKPEMNAVVNLKITEEQEMKYVPSSAIIFDKDRYWVMVFKSKTNIETRQVEVYKESGDITYIKSGLLNGDKIISHNGLYVYDALND